MDWLIALVTLTVLEIVLGISLVAEGLGQHIDDEPPAPGARKDAGEFARSVHRRSAGRGMIRPSRHYGADGPNTTAFRNSRFKPRWYPRKLTSSAKMMTRPPPTRSS